jgi:hypothetical protein
VADAAAAEVEQELRMLAGRMPGVKYLGLAGQAGAGKDFVCSWLNRHSKLTVVRVAFADGVREEITKFLWLTPEQAQRLFKKPYTYESRRLQQWWGTDLRRKDDPDYWVKKGMEKAEELLAFETFETLIVFTDVRFGNEAEAIQRRGGMVLEVIAPPTVRDKRNGGMQTPSHASEEIDFETDGVVENGRDGEWPVFTLKVFEWLELDAALTPCDCKPPRKVCDAPHFTTNLEEDSL